MKTYQSKRRRRERAAVNGGWWMQKARRWGVSLRRSPRCLRGKHKPTFSPHVDGGDFVIVTNCEKIAVTGDKLDTVRYYRHSRYPGGLKSRTMREQLDRHPDRVHLCSGEGHDAKDEAGARPDEEAAGLCRQRASA